MSKRATGPLLLALMLALGPQLALCQPEPPRQWDPLFGSQCPAPTGGCGRGVSMTTNSGGQCCASCSNYTGSCSAACLSLNMSSTPCFSTCGDAGCKRSLCGEPLEGGMKCCSARSLQGCSGTRKIYLSSDCCPVCHTAAGAVPESPRYCRFNMTRGVGQPVCDQATGKCRLAAVNDRRDDPQFNMTLLHQVCSAAELAPLMQLMGSVPGMGGPAAGGPMMTTNGTTPTQSMPSQLDGMRTMLGMYGALIQNLTRLPEVASRIPSVTCREPMLCLAKLSSQLVPLLNSIIGPINATLRTLSTGSIPSSSVASELTAALGTFSTRIGAIGTKSAACMALVQTQSPCVSKAQSINMEEIIRASRCNISVPGDFAALRKLAAKVQNDSSRNRPPGLETLAALNCSDVSNECAVDFVTSLLDRTASSCVNANLINAARDRLRRHLFDCVGGPQNLTQDQLVTSLKGCRLNGGDLRKIAEVMPSRLQAIFQDRTEVSIDGARITTSAMVLKKLMTDCPDIKAVVDKILAQTMDLSRLSSSDTTQMINAIRADQMGRIPANVWMDMGKEALANISERLLNDPQRDSKCQELVRLANQSLLANLTACIGKMPPAKLLELFGSGPERRMAAQSFNVSRMKPNDVARNMPVLRDLLRDVVVNESNCMTYVNSLFSFPRDKIHPSMCLNDTCFREMCSIIPDHSNTVYCRGRRPAPTVSSMVDIGPKGMAQLTPAEVRDALSGAADTSSFQSLLSSFADTGSDSAAGGSDVSSSGSDYSERLNAMKKRSFLGALMEKFQETFLTGASLGNFSAADVDPTILCQMNSNQLKRLPCSQMSTVAYRAGTYVASVNRGAGRAIVDCICQSTSNCANISSSGVSQLSNYVLFINETELANLPADALPTFCHSVQSLSISEKSKKMSMSLQRVVHAKCISRFDMSSVGGSNSTDIGSLAVWNSTIIKAVMVCALTPGEINKLDQDAAEYLVSVLPRCPFNETWLRAVCTRLFRLYNDSAISGNYSMSTIGMCAVHLGSGLANTTKVSRDDVRTGCGAVSDAFRQNTDACFVRATNGLQNDCAASFDSAARDAFRAVLGVLDSNSPFAGRRRRKRSTSTPLTCSDIQNLASGVAQVSAAQIGAMAQSEFQTCFSTFGLTNTNWSSDQCVQLKTKTEAAYNVTSMWSSTVLLTVGCLTQCWSTGEIAQIPYSDVAHISDIGKYCKLMPTESKMAIVSAYITQTKSNNSAMMTRTELSSLGHLTCGADATYVDNFNHTNVVNSLTELGTPGPCDASVMQSYIGRLKQALGGSVAIWQSSYFTGLANLISGLSTSDIPTLTSDQIGYIDASVISGMTVSKFKEFTSTQFTSFSASQRSAVTTSQLAVLSNSQKAALGVTTSAAGRLVTNTLLVLGCLGAYVGGRWFGI